MSPGVGAFFARPIGQLVIALAIGLVVGAERERRSTAGPRRVPAGIRTFTVVALMGGVVAQLGSPALLAIVAAAVAGVAIVAWLIGDRSDPGLTTELALLCTYCLGAFAARDPSLALGAGLSLAAVLALRTELHTVVKSVLNERELLDGLLFAIAAVVILPLLPNEAIDPFGVVNPFRLWRLVVVFMGMSAAGYVAQRAIGPRFGLAVAGFGSGFVSSAATVAAMGQRAKENEAVIAPAVAGAVASNVATLIQLAILVGAANPHLLARLALPLGCGAVTAVAFAALQLWNARRAEAEADRGRAFRLTAALFFAGFVTALSLLSIFAERIGGAVGVLTAGALAGFVDAHAPAAALASVAAADHLSLGAAALGVLLALTTNAVTKIFLAIGSRCPGYARRVVLGTGLSLLAAWAGLLLSRR